MNEEHAEEVAAIEAVTKDYVEVFEPPRYCEPPFKAVGEVISGGVNVFAGGLTWVSPRIEESYPYFVPLT